MISPCIDRPWHDLVVQMAMKLDAIIYQGGAASNSVHELAAIRDELDQAVRLIGFAGPVSHEERTYLVMLDALAWLNRGLGKRPVDIVDLSEALECLVELRDQAVPY